MRARRIRMLNTWMLLLCTWTAMLGASACGNPRERHGAMDSGTQSRTDAGGGGMTAGAAAGSTGGAGGARGGGGDASTGTGGVGSTTDGAVSVGQPAGSGGAPAVTPIGPVTALSQYDNGCVVRSDS